MYRVLVPVPIFKRKRNAIRLAAMRNVKVFECQNEEDAGIVSETLLRQSILTKIERRVWEDVTPAGMIRDCGSNEADILHSLTATFGEEEY
jgi:hypothetical protein